MTKLQDKAQAQVKQMVGQMIGDDRLVQEGRAQQQHSADQAQGADDEKQRRSPRRPVASKSRGAQDRR